MRDWVLSYFINSLQNWLPPNSPNSKLLLDLRNHIVTNRWPLRAFMATFHCMATETPAPDAQSLTASPLAVSSMGPMPHNWAILILSTDSIHVARTLQYILRDFEGLKGGKSQLRYHGKFAFDRCSQTYREAGNGYKTGPPLFPAWKSLWKLKSNKNQSAARPS